jgi:hypothetical protein
MAEALRLTLKSMNERERQLLVTRVVAETI